MSDARLLGVLGCFFLSGFAALLYQTVWTRQFAFVFGTSELAVATVLAAYMGGLAGGAALAGRLAHRVRRPVLVYGLLELGIALAALAVPTAVRGATALHVLLFGGLAAPPDAGGLAAALFYLAASFVILMVPTALMGATLPLLARHAVRSEQEIGSRVGLLYATNTVGAIGGVLVAAFALLPALGLRDTVLCGVAVNALVFALALGLARHAPLPPAPAASAPRARPVTGRAAAILPFVLLSGAASFSYEVLWTRLLGHLLGGSVYAFATMLASFLAGIAVGSAAASRLATSRARAAQGFALAQLATGALALAAFAGIDALPGLARELGIGAQVDLLSNVALAGLVLLPQTLCIGATFPFAVRVLARDAGDAAPASARVYAWNTVGAIVGAVGSGFFLIPALGYAGTLAAGVAVNLALAAASCALVTPFARRPALAAAALGVLLLLRPPSTPWGVLRSSPLDLRPLEGEVTFAAVGRAATVLLVRPDKDPDQWYLRTNGLPEATIEPRGRRFGGTPTNDWLGAVAALARPEARRMLMIGLGGGLALEAVPSSFEAIDVIELEPEVVAANRAVGALRRKDPLAEPRVRVRLNDARGALTLTHARYDAVVSQPSHPWTGGASHLYTREFFALVRDRMTPDGVFVQWIGLAFVDEVLLRTLVATLQDAFAHVRVYQPEPASVLFLASPAPLDLEASAARAIAAAPREFARFGLGSAGDAALALVLDERGARRFAEGAQVNTDDRNLLEMRSPRILRAPILASGVDAVLAPYDPLTARPPEDALYAVRRLLAMRAAERAERLAATLDDPAQRATAQGLIALARGQREAARAQLDRALRLDPTLLEARVAWLRLERASLVAGAERARERAQGLPDPAAAVVEGWQRQAEGDFAALRTLEPRLAAAAQRDPAFRDAQRLRALWRERSGDPRRAGEAVELCDGLLGGDATLEDLFLRARAARAAGDDAAALATLSEAVDFTRARPQLRRAAAREAAQLLALLPPGADDAADQRSALRAKIEKALR